MDWVLKQSFNHFLSSFCEPLQDDGLQLSFVDGLVVKDLVIRPDAINQILAANDTDMRIDCGRIGCLRMCYTAVPGVMTMQMSNLDIRIRPNALKTIGKTIRNKITDLVNGPPPDPCMDDQLAYHGGYYHPDGQAYYPHLPITDFPAAGMPMNQCGDPDCQSPACYRPLFVHPAIAAAAAHRHEQPHLPPSHSGGQLHPHHLRAKSTAPPRKSVSAALCGISTRAEMIRNCPRSQPLLPPVGAQAHGAQAHGTHARSVGNHPGRTSSAYDPSAHSSAAYHAQGTPASDREGFSTEDQPTQCAYVTHSPARVAASPATLQRSPAYPAPSRHTSYPVPSRRTHSSVYAQHPPLTGTPPVVQPSPLRHVEQRHPGGGGGARGTTSYEARRHGPEEERQRLMPR